MNSVFFIFPSGLIFVVFKITSVSPVSLLPFSQSYHERLRQRFVTSHASSTVFPCTCPSGFHHWWKPHVAFCGSDQPPLQQKPPSKMNKRELAECLDISVDFASQHGKVDLVEMLREKRLRADPPALAPQPVPGDSMQDEMVIPEPVARPVAESSGKTMQLKVGMREPEPGSEQDYYVRVPQPGSKMSYCWFYFVRRHSDTKS